MLITELSDYIDQIIATIVHTLYDDEFSGTKCHSLAQCGDEV
jgi:hypothetical protein